MKVTTALLAIILVLFFIALSSFWAYKSGLQAGLEHAKLDSYQGILRQLAYLQDLKKGRPPFPPEEAQLEFVKFHLEQYLHTENLSRVSGRLFWNIGQFIRGEPSAFTVPWTESGSTAGQLSKVLDICRAVAKEEQYRMYCADPVQANSDSDKN
jgi:hypothetical protein